MSQTKLTHQLKKGFTLVEMLVIAPILILAIGGFVVVIISMVGDAMKSRDSNALVYNTQASLDRIEQDIRLGVLFDTTTGTLTSPQGSNNGTAAFTYANTLTNGSGALIIRSLSTDKNPGDNSRQIIYYENQPNACGATQNYNNPFISTVIYYVANDALYRRTIVPSYTVTSGQSNTVCDAPWQQNSCSPGVTGAQCQTQDAKLMDDVTSLEVTYLSTPSGGTTTPANATTLSVKINSSKDSAGSSLTNAATVRATKINSSSVATPQQLVFTTHPTSKTVAIADTNIQFTAAASLPSTYTWERSTNNGTSWTTISGATSSTLTISSVDATWNGNQFRAVAYDQYGRSLQSSTATLTVGIWGPIALKEGWYNYTGGGGYADANYTKTSDGVVMLKGLISCSGTAPQASSQVIGTLPAGYRPYGGTLIFQTNSSNDPSTNQVSSRVDVQTDGDILLQYGNCGWTTLDGIHFIAATAGYTPTALTPYSNSWVDYSSGFAVGTRVTDATGRVHTQGLVRNGVATNGTLIAPLGSTLRPPEYQHFTARNNGAGHLGYDATSGILAKGGPNGYQSLNVMYYPGTTTAGWTNITLTSGWTWYGSIFSTPQYRKSADGIVTLKGLIGGGANGSLITTLPANYRPKDRLILAAVQNAAAGRIDVLPDGRVFSIETSGNTWVSLDSINFRAEQ